MHRIAACLDVWLIAVFFISALCTAAFVRNEYCITRYWKDESFTTDYIPMWETKHWLRAALESAVEIS